MGTHRIHPIAILAIAIGACSGSCDDLRERIGEQRGGPAATATDVVGEPLLSQDGQLAAQPGSTTASRVNFELSVGVGDQITVDLRSSAFDPVVQVTPPGGGGALTNDDWQGSRAESRLDLIVGAAGTLKVVVTSFQAGASGPYQLRVVRTNGAPAVATGGGTPAATTTPFIAVGQTHRGEVGPGDVAMADGRYQEQLLVAGADQGPLELRIRATGAQVPNAVVLDPQGRALAATASGSYPITQPGPHRVQMIAGTPGAASSYELSVAATSLVATPSLQRDHHQLPTGAATATVALDRAVIGDLGGSDGRLPTGEPADIYSFAVTDPGRPVTLELRSSDFDPYLMLVGPTGRHWENDDAGGGLDSALQVTLADAGTYRVVATAYRSDMSGSYELKVSSGARQIGSTGTVATGAANPGGGAPTSSTRGELAAGDSQLPSGEWVDEHTFEWQAGQAIHIEARSTDFDTYLIVRPPSGSQQDNDDGPGGGTNAAIEYVASSTGSYRVQVTSYRPGETGSYDLVLGSPGGPGVATAPPSGAGAASGGSPAQATAISGDQTSGALQSGDRQLQSGEFADYYTQTFETGRSVQIRMSSDAIDSYLIVRTPGGQQLDNDDLERSTRTAGIDIPAAEAGEYTIIATSYRAGEAGGYQLSFGAGQAVPRPTPVNPAGGAPAAAPTGEGGRVFGLFAGISDYPGSGNDLPECANDAIKLAEALRNRRLLTEDRQIVLTDSQATTANVRSALTRMASQVGPDDVFVFFYSGHGNQRQGSQDPREIDGTDEEIVLYDGPLLDDEVGRLFDGIRARVALVAFDSCYSGGFAKDVITRPGRMGLFSSEEDVLSAVAGQFQAGGYLSHFLRTAIGEADSDPNDQVLTVGELTHYVHRQFAQHATDVRLAGAYQHLVVDRGAVRVDHVLWSYR